MPTIYEQLQEILKAMEDKIWRRAAMHKASVSCEADGVTFVSRDEYIEPSERMSYHDLFSKDSGFMEAVKWKSEGKMIMIDAEIIQDSEGLPGVDAKDSADDFEPKYRYMEMGPMTAEDKVRYVLDNIVIPGQK